MSSDAGKQILLATASSSFVSIINTLKKTLTTTIVCSTVGGIVLWYFLSPTTSKKQQKVKQRSQDKKSLKKCDGSVDLISQFKGHHTIHRQSILANGSVKDQGDSVVYVSNPNFDLNATIYKTLDGTVPRTWMKSKLGFDVYWDDAIASNITQQCAHIPISLDHNKNVIDFMQNECNFICEHNEGSFMDHLQFVYDYAKNYYKDQSPRILLLHSIMGVATNIFPMEANKENTLQTLLTDTEMKHVRAFPSVLRLLLVWDLLDELRSIPSDKLQTLKGISFHRCLDNQKMELTGEEFWIHLNFHLIHFLDFMPVANWKLCAGEITLQALSEIHQLLTRSGKLFAKVDLDCSDPDSTATMPFTLASCVYKLAPTKMLRNLGTKSVRKFSAKIGHSTDYELLW